MTPELNKHYREKLVEAIGRYSGSNTVHCRASGSINPNACMGGFSLTAAEDTVAFVFKGFPLTAQPWTVAGNLNGLSNPVATSPTNTIGVSWLKMLLDGPFREIVPFIVNVVGNTYEPDQSLAGAVARDGGLIFERMPEINKDFFVTFCLANRVISEIPSVGLTYALLSGAHGKSEASTWTASDRGLFSLMFSSVDGQTFYRRPTSHGMPLGATGPEYYKRWTSGVVHPGKAVWGVSDAKAVFRDNVTICGGTGKYTLSNAYAFMTQHKEKSVAQAA